MRPSQRGGEKAILFLSLLPNSGLCDLLPSYVPLDVHDQPFAIVSVVHGLHVHHSGLNARFIL